MRLIYWSILISLMALCGCRKGGLRLSQLQEKQERLAQETADMSRTVSDLRRTYLKALDSKEEDFNEFAQSVRRLNETADAIRETMGKFAEYKKDYRKHVRTTAPGLVLGDVAFGMQTYRNARIKEVTDTHIAIMHHTGSSRIPLAQAPLDLQDRFAYDPGLDVVVAQSTGTGTDWLLSAIDAVQRYTADQAGSRPGGDAKNGASSSQAQAASQYASQSDLPAWRRFSSFTGSFWAPLQNRKRATGSANSFSPSYLQCP